MSPKPLTPGVSASKNDVLSSDPLVFLYEFEIPTSPISRLRLAGHDDEVEWDGNVYGRAPAMHSTMVEDLEGNLPAVQVTVPNSTREVAAIMKSFSGLADQAVRITLVSLADLSSGQPITAVDFTVVDGSVSVDSATLRLQVFSPRKATLPGGRIARQGCWYKFRGARCGFALSEADTGALTCDHSFDGENGCAAKGLLYTAAGLTAIHPGRFGGFRSVPRQQQGGGL
jgi:phage-related protein